MGVKERREREKERRRNEIIDAAERVFFSKGYIQATMDEVARDAELSKGAIYLYFRSKEELYLAINHRGLTLLEAMFAAVMAEESKGIELVRCIGEAYVEFSERHPDYFNAQIYYEAQGVQLNQADPHARACMEQGQKVLSHVVQAIQIGIHDGSVGTDTDPMELAIQLWGTTMGLIQLYHKRDVMPMFQMIQADDLIPHYFDLVEAALST
ncbi:MAG: helix-turn-helix domain-containing protein [Candidatus Latescibacteria bacterium]|jgi:AcrR family transcriptional regulator|nr:helix-turn-helix domain-containing protein [Candidatus Latescibacterota bacterium]